MGILRSGILGPLQNTTGAVVTKIVNGQNISTGKYRISEKRKEGSEKQNVNRANFTLLNDFLKDIQDLVEQGFKKRQKKQSAINAAYQYNYADAFLGEGENVVLDYPKIVYSIGNVEPPESPVLSSSNGNIIVSWYDMPQSKFCQYSDLGSLLIYDQTGDECATYCGYCKRGSLEVVLKLETWEGKEVHCFMNFDSADGKRQGQSVYLGKITIVGTPDENSEE